jgi:hypothetical protein
LALTDGVIEIIMLGAGDYHGWPGFDKLTIHFRVLGSLFRDNNITESVNDKI